MEILQGYELRRITNAYNGSGRYVIHYLALADNYERAIKLANTIDGRKYNTKQFRGCLVFTSSCRNDLARHIARVSETLNNEAVA